MSPERSTIRAEIAALPGIKQRELKPCALCGKPPARDNYPLFWRVSLERFCIDAGAVRRHAGLEQLIGSPAIAHAMGVDADMAKEVFSARQVLVCEPCVTEKLFGVHIIAEREGQ